MLLRDRCLCHERFFNCGVKKYKAMKKLAIVVLLSGFVVHPVWADDFYDFPVLDDNAGRFYAGADMVSATYSGSFFPSTAGLRITGGYNFSAAFAIETGYAILSNTSNNCNYGCGYGGGYGYGGYNNYPPQYASYASYAFNASSLQIAAIGKYPLSDAFSIFGKIGFDHNSMNYASTDNNGNNLPTISGSQSNRLYGIGGEYNMGEGIVLRTDFEDLGNVAPGVGMRMISLGGVYNF